MSNQKPQANPVQLYWEVHEELSRGGEWLGKGREWLQSNVPRGDRMIWQDPNEDIKIRGDQIHELMLKVAVAAVYAERIRRAKEVDRGVTGGPPKE